MRHFSLSRGFHSNGRGASTLSGGSLTQGDLGYVDTGSLHMTASGNVGSVGQAIKTSADTVSGSAGGDFAVNVKGNVTLGNVSAGKIADITAEDGITQAAGAALSASRVNLDAGSGAITGASGALAIETKQGSGEAYGLKASADGDISITNTGGNLYLDSVTSKHGDVTLTTDGSFIDNNFTDVANENAKAKLDAWAKARVLEGSETTISKQKSLRIAKVQGKYNEYQSLKGYVKDGQYTLDDTAKAALAKKGVTDIDAYIAEKQARYDELKATVGTWKKEEVQAYVNDIQSSTDSQIYGNAALKADGLTSDAYLTAAEKAEVLVGSAKSAQDLLVTYSGGSIKEGITDTQTTQKETAHVTGQNVTLTAKGGKTGENARGIGHKENGQVIDLSTKEKIESLTADQLIALASAERGDFKVDDKTVTVSSIRSIAANADGKLIAKAENGAVYLTSDTGVKEGSELLSGGELRMKATDDLKNVKVGAKDQIVLESGEGEISGVIIQNGGTLTARAKKGVSLSKDGDLVIHTVYASDGDVALDLKSHSLYAEDGHDTDEEMGTTYTNVEGENISIENVVNVKGKSEGQSLGMKVTGTKAKDGSTVPGSIRFQATGDADITLFGEAASDQTSIEAGNTAITNHGKISKGSYKANGALHVYNANGSTITGGTFTGRETTLTNQADLSGAKVEGTEKLTVTNTASIQHATLTGGAAAVDNHGKNSVMKDVTLTGSAITFTNEGTVENGSYTAETGAMTVKNSGKLSAGAYTAKAGTMGITNRKTIENAAFTAGGALTYDGNADSTVTETTMTGASVDITNAGTLTNGSYTAKTGAMTVTNSGKLSSGTYIAKAGTMGITNRKTIENGTFTAGGALTYDGNADSTVTETTMTGASVGITNAGTFTNGSYTAGGAMTVTNSGQLSAGKYTAAGTMGITNEGTIENGAYTSRGDLTYTDTAEASLKDGTLISEEGKAKVTAHGVLRIKKLSAKDSATVEADHDVTLTEAEAGTLAVLSGGSVKADTLTATAGDASVIAKMDVMIETLKAEAGVATIEATEGALNVGALTAKDAAKLTSGGAMEVTHASAGSVNANAGTTLHLAKLVSTGEVVLTSKDEATLDDVTAGTLEAESTAGSVNAGTLTATAGDASVKAKKDVTIGTLTAEAGAATIEATEGALNVGALTAKDAAKVTSGMATTLGTVIADSVTANAGTTLSAKTLTATKAADLTSGNDMVLTEAHANTLTAKAGGKLTATTLGVTGAAGLTSGGAMEVSDANVGSVTANAGTTLHVKKLTATGEAALTSKDEATLDDVTAGTLNAESKAGSVNAGTLTAKTGDASVKAKTDVTIGTLTAKAGAAKVEATDGALDVTTLNAKSLTANAGTTLNATTLAVKDHAELTSGGATTLGTVTAGSVTAKAGTTLDVTKLHTAGDAGLASGSDMILHEAEAGGKLTASADGSISVKGMDAKISGSAIEMTAKEDIRITDHSPVGKLDGVDTSLPAGTTTGSGAAGSLVTGEAKPHDFDASQKGSAQLSSTSGKVTLSAKKVEIDTLNNGEGSAADLTISADNIGIDDLTGKGAQRVTIHGADGQSQAHYAGIHSSAAGGTLVKDSAVEHLNLTGKEPLGIKNTAIGGDSVLATDKIRVTIQKNPGSSQAEHFGNLSLNGYDIATDHVMTSVKDGLTVNGERFPMTAEGVMNASLYEDRTLGRDGREKEEETKKDSPSLAFGAPNDKEAYEVVK